MPDLLTIRPTSAADLPEIDALFRRSYPALLKQHYAPSLMVLAVPLIAKANPRLLTSGSYFAVKDASGAIVGAGGWTASDPQGHRRGAATTGHVRHVVTDHRRVREGIGRALMGHICDHARQSGIMRLDCLSTRMAVPFYEACGFQALGPLTINLGPGIEFPVIRMQRPV